MSSRKRAAFLPVFAVRTASAFPFAILKMALVVAVPAVALWWFGQPALLGPYWWHGSRSHPVFERCRYLALDGWHDVIPGFRGASEGCPPIRLVPADLKALIWG